MMFKPQMNDSSRTGQSAFLINILRFVFWYFIEKLWRNIKHLYDVLDINRIAVVLCVTIVIMII